LCRIAAARGGDVLTGRIVTIDAMGYQTKIVEQIVAGEADYVLAFERQSRHVA